MERRFRAVLRYTRLRLRRPDFAYKVRTVNLSFRHFGDSLDPDEASVLLLHGLLGSKKHWEGIAKTISNMTKLAVITLDLRNHGDSPHVNSHKYTDMAMDVEELMAKQGIEKAMLIGHSMGGRAAMTLALMKPELISGIIVVDISPVSTCPQLLEEMPKILATMEKIDFASLEIKQVSKARKHVKKLLRDVVRDDISLEAILSNINVRKDGVIGWTCNLNIFIRHLKYITSFPKSLLDRVYPGPTLFIGGQLSEYIPPDDLTRIRDIFPQATVIYVPNTGHLVHAEDPNRFMELVITFIKNNRKLHK